MLRRALIALVIGQLMLVGSALGATDPTAIRATVVAELAPLQLALRTDHAAAFGGLWVEATGQPVVALAGPDDAALQLVATSALYLSPRVVEVKYSEAQLDAVHTAVRVAAGDAFSIAGIRLAAIETDIVNNRVNVVAIDASAGDLAKIQQLFGSAVVATSVTSQTAGNSCTKANCPNPLKGGLKLYQHSTFWCMSGFVMYYSSSYWLSTAGHCSTIGDTYQHPSGTNIGSVSGDGWVSNSAADASIIRISATQAGNLYLLNNSGYTLYVTSVENPAAGQEVIGESACVSPQASSHCGTLKSINNTVAICEGGTCRTILWLRRASFATVAGDSGAPVTVAGKAMGIVSASYPGVPGDSLYSHEKNIESYFLLSTKITP